MFSGPTRGGTRGGAAEFKWSDVKEDKDREHYLGHSVMAAAGRWQKNQDIHWYSRDQETADEAAQKKANEIRKVKEAEEDALALALGFAPAVRKTDEEKEVERLLKEQQKQEKALRKAERHAEKLIKAEIKANIKAERKALKETSHVSENDQSPRAVDKEKQNRERDSGSRDQHASRRRDDDRSSRYRDEERIGGRGYSSKPNRESRSNINPESGRDRDGRRGPGPETERTEWYRTRSRSPKRRNEDYRRDRSPIDRDGRSTDSRPYNSRDRESERERERYPSQRGSGRH